MLPSVLVVSALSPRRWVPLGCLTVVAVVGRRVQVERQKLVVVGVRRVQVEQLVLVVAGAEVQVVFQVELVVQVVQVVLLRVVVG